MPHIFAQLPHIFGQLRKKPTCHIIKNTQKIERSKTVFFNTIIGIVGLPLVHAKPFLDATRILLDLHFVVLGGKK